MGDYAKGIARICILTADHPPVKPLIDIPKMAEKTVDMLRRALEAFAISDASAARLIPKEDDEVDRLYNQVMHELVDIMVEDNTFINRANYFMWASHNLERMADRVTNICERTIYVVTGTMEEIKSSDDEQNEQMMNILKENS
jgi:phosphate transport system protein